jgi:hypothetical protein
MTQYVIGLYYAVNTQNSNKSASEETADTNSQYHCIDVSVNKLVSVQVLIQIPVLVQC